MYNLKDCIPTAESLKRRAFRVKSEAPSRDSMDAIARRLADYGYTAENPEVYSAICSYGALMLDGTNRKGLFLKGECGIGKTFGVEILAAIFSLPVFTPAAYVSAYKELNGNPCDLEKYVITGGDFFERPKNVVIDEIGTMDTATSYGEKTDIMCEVLDARYRAFFKHGVITIITTNLSDRDICARYGIRIEDRLREFFYIKRVSGRSLR